MLRPPVRALPSVIVVTEKVMREADEPMKRAVPRPVMRNGWKGVRPRVRLESRSGEPVRSPKTAYTQVKMEDAPKLLENSIIGMSRHLDSSTKTQMAKSLGPVWKTQSFLLSEICIVILWQDCYGKGNLRKSYRSTVGRRFPIGNAYSCTVIKDGSYLCMWMASKWLERNKI